VKKKTTTTLSGNADLQRLQSDIDCLEEVVALRATRSGKSPAQMSRSLIKLLFAGLQLDLCFVRFARKGADEAFRQARSTLGQHSRRIDTTLRQQWGEDSDRWPRSGSAQFGKKSVSIASLPLALAGQDGVLVAGSQRADFPTRSERSILEVAADQLLLTSHEYLRRAQYPNSADERDFRHIVDNIPGMVAAFSSAGEVEFVNQRILDYFGGGREEHGDWKGGQRTHPEDTPRVVDTFKQSIASGEPWDIEVRARRFDGVYRWFQSRGQPLKDSSGRIVRWYNLLTDIDDRKKAEHALQASERTLSLMINAIPAMIQVSQANGAVQSVNQVVLEYYGVDLKEMQQPEFRNRVYHPDDVERLQGWRDQALEKPVPFEYEQRALGKDGVYRWFFVRYKPLLDEQGKIERWYASAFDIDDRKRAEEALEVREAQLRHALTQLTVAQQVASVGSFTTDLAADEHIWSDEFYRICEFEPGSKITLQRFLDIVQAEDLARTRAMIEQSLAGKEGVLEFRIVTHRGAVKHLRAATRLVQQGGGGRNVFMGAVQDVTETILAQQTLMAREAELQRLLNHLNEAQRLSKTGSVTADLIKNEHLWSDELYRICEFDPGKVITNPTMLEILHPDDVPVFHDLIQRCFAGENPEFEFRIITRSGVQKHLRGFAHRIEQATKQAMFVGAMQDVTAERLAEQDLNRARSELAHVSRVMTLGTLTASIAHEINQPLSGILMNADTCQQMLEASPPNLDSARLQVQRILRDTNRAAEVIKRLRSLFSRNQPKSAPVDLADASREVLNLSASELQRHGVLVRTDFEESLPLVRGDRVQLQQVVLNLVLNAADAMSEIEDRPRVLTVTCARELGTTIRFSVSDTGVGLGMANPEKLFEAFHTTKSHGMGIGLSISRTIVENHEGRLWAAPNEGGFGATFSFCLPCQV
jgi:PAS domain S-box-containing protein